MPIYEYQCTQCQHQFESLQKMSDPELTDCPKCNQLNVLKKLISAAAFRLKGGGWYETDYKSGNKKNVESSDTTTSKNGDSSKTDNSTSVPSESPAVNSNSVKTSNSNDSK
ncbi:MAG: zinc ribbon domain-containing protein [Pseudomonadota bacterium]